MILPRRGKPVCTLIAWCEGLLLLPERDREAVGGEAQAVIEVEPGGVSALGPEARVELERVAFQAAGFCDSVSPQVLQHGRGGDRPEWSLDHRRMR